MVHSGQLVAKGTDCLLVSVIRISAILFYPFQNEVYVVVPFIIEVILHYLPYDLNIFFLGQIHSKIKDIAVVDLSHPDGMKVVIVQ